MEQKTDFEKCVEQQNAMAAHEAEIQNTRVGGLGGSDAAMVLKIGRDGLGALSATDMQRLAVMLGLAEQEKWSNAYTNAGHAFEDFVAQTAPYGKDVKMERETLIKGVKLAKHFKVFAHADFTIGKKANLQVIECKYVTTKDTDAVCAEYMAQLQWYYMLGAKEVCLLHGTGAVPFDADQVETVNVAIERNDETVDILLAGLHTLDEAIADGWQPIMPDKIAVDETPTSVQKAFAVLESVKRQREALDKQEANAKEILQKYMTDLAYTSVYDTAGNMCTISKPSQSRTFDAKKFLAKHAEFDVDEWYKVTNRAESLSFKAAKVEQ